MSSNNLPSIFTHIEPFKSTLLNMLFPFDIAKLLIVINCVLTPWERYRHMDVFHDIFCDPTEIYLMRDLGMKIRIFGADFAILEERLRDPCKYLSAYKEDHSFHIFVLVTDRPRGYNARSTLLRDHRPEPQQHLMPEDLSLDELSESFSSDVASNIATLSKWILCAPHLSGSLSNAIPGWIPIFNARQHVNVRAYISTFNDCNARILHINRVLMRQVFGYQDNRGFLSSLSNLVTVCYVLENGKRTVKQLRGRLTTNVIHQIFAAAQYKHGEGQDNYVVVNALHPLNSSITLDLE